MEAGVKSWDEASGPSADGCVIKEVVSVMREAREKERGRRVAWEEEEEAAASIER